MDQPARGSGGGNCCTANWVDQSLHSDTACAGGHTGGFTWSGGVSIFLSVISVFWNYFVTSEIYSGEAGENWSAGSEPWTLSFPRPWVGKLLMESLKTCAYAFTKKEWVCNCKLYSISVHFVRTTSLEAKPLKLLSVHCWTLSLSLSPPPPPNPHLSLSLSLSLAASLSLSLSLSLSRCLSFCAFLSLTLSLISPSSPPHFLTLLLYLSLFLSPSFSPPPPPLSLSLSLSPSLSSRRLPDGYLQRYLTEQHHISFSDLIQSIHANLNKRETRLETKCDLFQRSVCLVCQALEKTKTTYFSWVLINLAKILG